LGRHRYLTLPQFTPTSAKSLCLVSVNAVAKEIKYSTVKSCVLLQTAVALLYLGFGAAYSGIMAACGGRWRRKRVSGDNCKFFLFFQNSSMQVSSSQDTWKQPLAYPSPRL
jgi:hypothetical protein